MGKDFGFFKKFGFSIWLSKSGGKDFFFCVCSFLFFHSLVVEKVRIAYLVLEKGEVMKRNVVFLFFIKES